MLLLLLSRAASADESQAADAANEPRGHMSYEELAAHYVRYGVRYPLIFAAGTPRTGDVGKVTALLNHEGVRHQK